jgi:hypothetical protein
MNNNDFILVLWVAEGCPYEIIQIPFVHIILFSFTFGLSFVQLSGVRQMYLSSALCGL